MRNICIIILNCIISSSAMIYLIRHAESNYNLAEAEMHHKLGDDFRKTQQYLSMKFDQQFLDVDITNTGIKQATDAAKIIADTHIDLVIVSPLLRALQTCHIIFKGHKSQPKVVVDPAFREIMESSNDIGSNLEQSMKLFTEYDFSMIKNPQTWFLESIADEESRNKVLKQLEGVKEEEVKSKAIEVALQFQKESWAEREKEPENGKLKAKVLPSLEAQISKLKELSQKYPSIAVVSHSENIKSFVRYKIKNCQIYPFKQQWLEQPLPLPLPPKQQIVHQL